MFKIRQFELLGDLRPEGQALAVLMRWNGEMYVQSTETIELWDVIRSHGDNGDRGYCFFSADSNRWESLSGLFQQIPGKEF